MNMYLHELKSLRKTTLLWVCALIALAAIYFSVYPGIVSDAAGFKKMLQGYPPAVTAALGISIDSITSLLNFYAMTLSFITLCGAIQAMNMGVSILSKETRERTADFLLVKPVSRAAIVNAKLLAALTMILATNVLYDCAAFLMASTVKPSPYSGKLFFMISATLFFIQLIFLAIGVVISVFFKKLKSVLPVSLSVVFGFYMIGALVATGKNDVTRFFFPFKYFNFPTIIKNASYEAPYLITGAVIVVVSIAAAYFIYTRKDIHAV
jgi:ABC-2 type transport system permease protein